MDNLLGASNLGKGVHLAHLNVRSVFGGGKLDMLKLQIEHSGIDVFSLSESWLTTSQTTW